MPILPSAGSAGAGADLLHVDARLHGRAARADRVGQVEVGQTRPIGEADLGGDEVDARDLFGHRVFDLKAGIGFDEDEGIGAVAGGIQQEFEGAKVLVTHAFRQPYCGVADGIPDRGIQRGGRGHFDHLLEPPLQGTFAFAQMHDRSGTVPQHLHFQVAGALKECLDIEIAGPEGGLGLGRRALEQRRHVVA